MPAARQFLREEWRPLSAATIPPMLPKRKNLLVVSGLLLVPALVALGEVSTVPRRVGHPIAGAVSGYYAAIVILTIIYYLRPLVQHRKQCPECSALLPKAL